MPDPTTTNISLAQPTRGSDDGTWDTPMNGNTTLLDLILGGTATIGLNNSNVTLSAAQYQCGSIVFNSTLTGSVSITFPTTYVMAYEIQNLCTGTSAFTITLTNGVGQVICAPPGEIVECRNDGTNIKYKNLSRIGSYWDYAGSSVPAWVAGCTVPPYLNCDGTSFSSATYPALTTILGGTTLPDSKGRTRFTLGQGSSRITSSQGGLDGTTLLAGGGAQTVALSSTNMPPSPVTDPGHHHTQQISATFSGGGNAAPGGSAGGSANAGQTTTNVTNILVGITSTFASSAAPVAVMPPSYVGGLTLIRAA